ncbi:uncharacterized protein [Physcomitrium patens]|uniref:uncharacterized protein n=1 Tax=Physcomitrium patens TaxID=3218 RepID=UPI003CCE4224
MDLIQEDIDEPTMIAWIFSTSMWAYISVETFDVDTQWKLIGLLAKFWGYLSRDSAWPCNKRNLWTLGRPNAPEILQMSKVKCSFSHEVLEQFCWHGLD